MLAYVDTSALVKLVLPEAESETLNNWRNAKEVRFITSDLTRTELLRAVRRTNSALTTEAVKLLGEVAFISLDFSVFEEAGFAPPPELRSLDAIHLTAARLAGSQLDGMLTYDDRLAEAAGAFGIRTFSPS